MMKVIGGILAILSLFVVLWKADKYVAHAEELRLVEMRLDQKIEGDRAKILQQQNWELKKEYRGRSMPVAVEKEIMDNAEEIENIKAKLNPASTRPKPGAK